MIKYLIILILTGSTCIAEEFYKTREWTNLLYYEKVGTSYQSIADNPQFFVSESGKTDPKLEYEESLKLTQQQDQVFRKTFPLRYKRITQANQLPYIPLVTPNNAVTSVTIAFPNQYMANPASIFGHLFLILNSENGVMDSDILHFIADTSGSSKYAYIYNGLSGNFKGWFLQEPYYKKIKDYTYLEDREITYYELSIPQERIEELQLHAIELKQTHFDYYFFDENCAFFIGQLLNVVLEEDLISRTPIITPSEIINKLEAKSLLKKEYHRKSSVKLFNTTFNQLSSDQQSTVVNLILKETNEVPTNSEVLTAFLSISEYLINNHSPLAQTIRHNRIKAYQELSRQEKTTVRPEDIQHSKPRAIQSKGLSMEYGLSGRVFLSYKPIYYSEYLPFGELEVKKLNAMAPRLVLGPHHSPQLDMTLVEISNISPYNLVVNSNSWRLASSIGYQNSTFTNTSFEYGRSYYFMPQTRLSAFLGANLTNYDSIAEEKLPSIFLRPSLNLGIEKQIIKERLNSSLDYDYKFDQSYLSAKVSFKAEDLIHQLTYIRGSEFEGIKFSVMRVF